MKKNTSKEAFYNRLQELSEITDFKAKINDRNIGTLVDIKRNNEGVAFGIIKENHNYYIKRGGTKLNPDASDFTYIGGLENITSYQFSSLAESEKQRNFMIVDMNRASGIKVNNNVSKMILNEDVAGDEIEKSEDSLDNLEAATAAEKASPEITANDSGNMSAGDELGGENGMGDAIGDMSAGGEMGDESPAGEEMPADTGEEGEEDDINKAIEKSIGKLTNTIRKADMTPEQTKSYLASLVASFKEKLPEIEVEDRKEIANKILKTNAGGEQDLENSMPDEVDETAETCNECGGFIQYAESRGYTKESIMECGNDEMESLISGYANAHNDGKNNGDAETVSLYTNEDVNDSLVNDYGHDAYVNEILKPEIMKLSEATDEDKQLKINELNWGNLAGAVGRGVGKLAGKGVDAAKDAVAGAGNAIAGAAKGVGNAVAGTANNVVAGAKDAYKSVEKDYRNSNQNSAVNAVAKIAQELKTKIDALNAATVKNGGKPVNYASVLHTLSNQLRVPNGETNLSKFNAQNESELENGNTLIKEEDNSPFKVYFKKDKYKKDDKGSFRQGFPTKEAADAYAKKRNDGINHVFGNDAVYVVTDAANGINEADDDLENIEDIDLGNDAEPDANPSTTDTDAESMFANDTQSLGAVNPSPMATTSTGTGVNVDIDAQSKTVNVTMNEGNNKPSAGLTKDNKSEIVKAAKKGEDIGKEGKGFEKVEKAAEKSGAKNPKAVAAAAMWKNAAKNKVTEDASDVDAALTKGMAKKTIPVTSVAKTPTGGEKGNSTSIAAAALTKGKVAMSESETILRKYVKNHLLEIAGMKKATLNENEKSQKLKQLDKLIESQYANFKKFNVK